MTERPTILAAPLVTLGDPTAEVCVDGWCGPVGALAGSPDQLTEVSHGGDPTDGVVRVGE